MPWPTTTTRFVIACRPSSNGQQPDEATSMPPVFSGEFLRAGARWTCPASARCRGVGPRGGFGESWCGPQIFLQHDRVFDTAVVTRCDAHLVVAVFAVEIARRAVAAPAFDRHAIHAGLARHGFEPGEHRGAHALAPMRGGHGEQQQVRFLVRVRHDAEADECDRRAYDDDIAIVACDRMPDARLGPAPTEALLDF